MSGSTPGLHLVLGDEELLVERAVAAVLRAARKQAGSDDVPVNRMRARDSDTDRRSASGTAPAVVVIVDRSAAAS